MNQWISVQESYPTYGDWVLLACEDGHVEQGYNLDGKQFYLSRTDSMDEPIEVWPTHWMSIPAAPEPSKEPPAQN